MEKTLFLFVVCLVALCAGQCTHDKSPPLNCKLPNEEESCMRECPPERTCGSRHLQYRCPETPFSRKCVCKNGFYRNPIGLCVSEADCERCPGPHEFFSCGGACDNICDKLYKQNRTNCPIVNIKCNEKCYCEDGYARNNDGVCVPLDKCEVNPRHKRHENKANLCINPNEVYTDCKRTCPPETCLSLVAFFKCIADPPCEPGCVCKEGFLRMQEDAPCKPSRECPQLANSPEFKN